MRCGNPMTSLQLSQAGKETLFGGQTEREMSVKIIAGENCATTVSTVGPRSGPISEKVI